MRSRSRHWNYQVRRSASSSLLVLALAAARLDYSNLSTFSVTAGSSKGDNYACEIKAVVATADVKGCQPGATYHYMAKCLPPGENAAKLVKSVSRQNPAPCLHQY